MSLSLIVCAFLLAIASYSNATEYTIIKAESNKNLSGSAEAEDSGTEDLKDGIIYHQESLKSDETSTSLFLKEHWMDPERDNFRRQMLEEFYYANTKSVSNSGRKNIACFTGNIDRIAAFLADNEAKIPIQYVTHLLVSISEDKKMVGIEYTLMDSQGNELHRHFRMPHCIQGAKAPLLSVDFIKTASTDQKKINRMVANLIKPKGRKPNNVDANRPEEENSAVGAAKGIGDPLVEPVDGYTQYDVIEGSVKSSFEKKIGRVLPTFKVRADYANFKPTNKSRPWVGINLSKAGEAEKLSRIILDYFYDSLIIDSKNVDNNLIAQNSAPEKSQWCHMPWLNVGEAGREAVHGLTKERDMEPTAIYPETMNLIFKKNGGSNWGVGFYNDIACSSLSKIFGNYNGGGIVQKPDPNFFQPSSIDKSSGEVRNNLFPDGSASVKVLFTTADLIALKNSFTWTAHTSLPRQTSRGLRPMRLLQIDVAIKDSKILGTNKDADHWLMLSYYFDENTVDNSFFANSILKNDARFTKTALAPFLKMRPIGVQWGFDPATSRIFKGSKTNTTKNDFHGISPNLLNGPADNPTSSCLSCHGAAGTKTRMVPGLKDYAHYKNIRQKGTLDFSMQLAFAKRNYETRPQMTK